MEALLLFHMLPFVPKSTKLFEPPVNTMGGVC